ncbi:MAG: hypothetical protein WCS70_09295, partial [Verrucomicrobiota bacterium]
MKLSAFSFQLSALLLTLCPLCLCGEIPPALDSADERAIQLALRALKMTERDLGFSKTNVESELTLTKSRLFLQEPLRLPGYAQSVASNCAAAANLRELVRFAFRRNEFSPQHAWHLSGGIIDPAFLTNLPPPVAEAIEQISLNVWKSRNELTKVLPNDQATALAGFAIEALHIDKDINEVESWQRLGIDTKPLKQFLEHDEQLELQDTELADAVLNASDQFDFGKLGRVSECLANAVDDAIVLLRTNTFTGDFQY